MNEVNNNTFEEIKHVDESGTEFWHARELMAILQYNKWQNFEKLIDKAKISCQNSNISVYEHFTDVSKLSKRANNAEIIITDYKLTRYACYLIAQNGDPRKEVISLAQMTANIRLIYLLYFKVKISNKYIEMIENRKDVMIL